MNKILTVMKDNRDHAILTLDAPAVLQFRSKTGSTFALCQAGRYYTTTANDSRPESFPIEIVSLDEKQEQIGQQTYARLLPVIEAVYEKAKLSHSRWAPLAILHKIGGELEEKLLGEDFSKTVPAEQLPEFKDRLPATIGMCVHIFALDKLRLAPPSAPIRALPVQPQPAYFN